MKTCSTLASTSSTMSSRSLRVLRRSSSCSERNWCRSSSAVNSSSASGLTLPSIAIDRSAAAQPLGLLLAVVRAPARAARRRRRPRRLHVDRRDELVGPVLGDQGLDLEAELLERPRLQRLHPQPQLGAGHLVLVDGVGEPVELGAEVAQPGADVAQRLLAPGAGGLDVGSTPGGLRRWTSRAAASTTSPTAMTAWAASASRIWRSRRSRARMRSSRSASADSSSAVTWPSRARARSSLVRSARRASVSARRASDALLGELLEVGGVGLFLGRRLGALESLLELGEAGQVALAGLLGRGDRGGQSLRLTARGAGRGAEVAELLGDGRHLGVRLVQPAQRGVDRAPAPRRARTRRPAARSAGSRPRGRRRRGRSSACSMAALTSIRLVVDAEPPAAKCEPRTSPSRVTAVTSDAWATRCLARSRSSTTATLNSSRRSAPCSDSGPSTTSIAYVAKSGSPGQSASSSSSRRRAASRRGRGPRT